MTNILEHVVDGIHMVADAQVNWYIVEEEHRVCVVDAGHPSSWRSLHDALEQIGRAQAHVTDVLLTHGHFDHVGFAERAREELGATVHVHELDRRLAEHPWSYRHERPRSLYMLRHPSFVARFTDMAAHGALFVKGVHEVVTFGDGDELDVAGRPQVVHLPGHTDGQCAFAYPDRGAIIVGDAIVTHDPYTNGDGPRIIAGAATADRRRALHSLDRLRSRTEHTLLPGHGDLWEGHLRDAVDHAQRIGAT